MPLMWEEISIPTSNELTKTFGITRLNYSGGIPSDSISTLLDNRGKRGSGGAILQTNLTFLQDS